MARVRPLNTPRESQCAGKEKFQTPQMAWRVARRKRKAADKNGRVAYRCQFCGMFHVGGDRK